MYRRVQRGGSAARRLGGSAARRLGGSTFAEAFSFPENQAYFAGGSGLSPSGSLLTGNGVSPSFFGDHAQLGAVPARCGVNLLRLEMILQRPETDPESLETNFPPPEMSISRQEMNLQGPEIDLLWRKDVLSRRGIHLPSHGTHLPSLRKAPAAWEIHLLPSEIRLQRRKSHLQPRRIVPTAQENHLPPLEIHPARRGEAGFPRKMRLFGQKHAVSRS